MNKCVPSTSRNATTSENKLKSKNLLSLNKYCPPPPLPKNIKRNVQASQTPPPPQESQIIDLITPAHGDTPSGQKEFEELLLTVGGDWEELFNLENENQTKILIHSDQLIKPVAATGREDLSLLRVEEEEEENFSDTEEAAPVTQPAEPVKPAEPVEPAEPEVVLRNQFEEAAGGMRQEISALKRKIEEKQILLQRNREYGENLIKTLQTKIEHLKKTQEEVTSILQEQKREEEYCVNILKNL